jgi:small subunit ribosomal protein S25
MPFKKGPAPWRRTLDYLNKGSLVFREKVKVCSINYHETAPESDGLRRFVFWHLAQIQYKNPQVQCVQLKNIVKSPFITFHTVDNDTDKVNSIIVNCYKKNEKEILDYCKELVGKTEKEIQQESQINVANFGEGCSRHCICLVEGQIPCPRYKPLPHFMRGKYSYYKKEELDEIRKTKSDKEALEEYWNSK